MHKETFEWNNFFSIFRFMKVFFIFWNSSASFSHHTIGENRSNSWFNIKYVACIFCDKIQSAWCWSGNQHSYPEYGPVLPRISRRGAKWKLSILKGQGTQRIGRVRELRRDRVFTSFAFFLVSLMPYMSASTWGKLLAVQRRYLHPSLWAVWGEGVSNF